ncbi:hypothetical protein RSK20926_22649 [Roseobacter sp. SK209-2-6]|uniref:hypothetical protein n=1 Tax=Roseobacter sp. SK209-2-6 TaxID=388739 RepID=UPI0000F3F327|nr:hypothetical protein [Roseobacter sp. SK209-2-6]EBA16573.1 hypothetical protein RSK20926_22649 [Roseobacter sp. SK209-2-6]
MTRIFFGFAAAIAILTLQTTTASSDDFTRITTKQQYVKLIVGKRWHVGDGYALAKRNGKLTGEFGGKELVGVWAWRNKMWCRTLETHAKDTDCQIISVNGKQMRIVKNQGQGDIQIMTRK